jgi:hypothetical protein
MTSAIRVASWPIDLGRIGWLLGGSYEIDNARLAGPLVSNSESGIWLIVENTTHMAETTNEEEPSLVNLAALYATLILIIGTVISEWPPEGQKEWFPAVLNDGLFVLSVLFTALIVLRILLLIWKSDPLFNGGVH